MSLGSRTLTDILTFWVGLHPSRPALVSLTEGRAWSYPDLVRASAAACETLAAFGIQRGDRVALWMRDGLDVVAVWYGLSRLGAVCVPINGRGRAEDAALTIALAGARWVVVDSEHRDRLVAARLPAEVQGCVLDGLAAGGSGGKAPSRPDPSSADDPVALLFTSGTTGQAKGSVHTQATLLGWSESLIRSAQWRWGDRILNPYPLFHMGGMGFTLAGLAAGATVVLLGPFDPHRAWEALRDERITSLIAVPTMLTAMVQHAPADPPALDAVAATSAPLWQETEQEIACLWPRAGRYVMYSATEAFFSVRVPGDGREGTRSVGRPAYGMEIAILDGDGRPLPPRAIGLVYGRGISLHAGYEAKELPPGTIRRGGWITCRDVGYLDEAGFLYLVDREKDVIKSGGESIASTEVEDVLARHPAVGEAAVVGVADPYWGERVHAVVVLRPGREVSAADLLAWCRRHLAAYKVPKTVRFAAELPKSAVGKVLKRQLRADAEGL